MGVNFISDDPCKWAGVSFPLNWYVIWPIDWDHARLFGPAVSSPSLIAPSSTSWSLVALSVDTLSDPLKIVEYLDIGSKSLMMSGLIILQNHLLEFEYGWYLCDCTSTESLSAFHTFICDIDTKVGRCRLIPIFCVPLFLYILAGHRWWNIFDMRYKKSVMWITTVENTKRTIKCIERRPENGISKELTQGNTESIGEGKGKYSCVTSGISERMTCLTLSYFKIVFSVEHRFFLIFNLIGLIWFLKFWIYKLNLIKCRIQLNLDWFNSTSRV
jgi:hypothetical protein